MTRPAYLRVAIVSGSKSASEIGTCSTTALHDKPREQGSRVGEVFACVSNCIDNAECVWTFELVCDGLKVLHAGNRDEFPTPRSETPRSPRAPARGSAGNVNGVFIANVCYGMVSFFGSEANQCLSMDLVKDPLLFDEFCCVAVVSGWLLLNLLVRI